MPSFPTPPSREDWISAGDMQAYSEACLAHVWRNEGLLGRASPNDLGPFAVSCRHARWASAVAGPIAEARRSRTEALTLAQMGRHERSADLLDQATEWFRWSAELFRAEGRPLEAKRSLLGAAEAIVRRAELKQDAKRLRLALAFHRRHFSRRDELGKVGFTEDDEARSDCCRCIAAMWLGEQEANPSAVTDVVSVLKTWEGQRALTAETRRWVALLIVAAMTVQARQRDTADGWRDVVKRTDCFLKGARITLANVNLHHYKARALHELGRFDQDVVSVLDAAELHRKLALHFERHSRRAFAARSWHARGAALIIAYGLPNADESLASSSEHALRTAQGFFSRERNSQEWLRVQADIAEVTGLRARREGSQTAARLAVAQFRHALDAMTAEASPVLFIRMARLLFYHQIASGWFDEAIETFADMNVAQDIVIDDPRSDGSAHRQLLREMREDFALAAWCLCKRGRPPDAVTVIDSGRARELAVKVRLLDDEPDGPRAADVLSRFAALAPMALTRGQAPDDARGGSPAERWADLVKDRHAAARGAIAAARPVELPEGTASVHVVMCGFGSFALVRTAAHPDRTHSFELCDPDVATLRRLVSRGSAAPGEPRMNWGVRYRELVDGIDDESIRRERMGAGSVRCTVAYAEFNDFLQRTLGILWRSLMGPVSDALTGCGVGRDDVVALCLPADLLRLPVLAATSDGGVVFGHVWNAVAAPSTAIAVRSFRLARERARDRSGKLLVVSNTRGWEHMPFAAAEASAIEGLAKDRPVVALSGDSATSANVLRHMSDCQILHASCHGHYDGGEPRNSGLEIANDARITFASLWHAPRIFRKARLCFLSACESGLVESDDLQDEFVGLPAGLMGAGVPGIICTLWPVFDDAAMEVSIAFYRGFFAEDGWTSAEASIRAALVLFRRDGWRETSPSPSLRTRGKPPMVRAPGRSLRKRAGPRARKLDVVRALGDCPYEWAGYVFFGA